MICHTISLFLVSHWLRFSFGSDFPLARVGHILVDRTLLKFLLLELQKACEDIFDIEIPLLNQVIVGLDDKGEPLKKRANLNDDGTQKQTRNRTETMMPSRRRVSGPTFRMPEGSSKEGRVRVSTGPYVQIICSVPLIVPGRSGITALQGADAAFKVTTVGFCDGPCASITVPKAHRGRSGRQGGRATRTGAVAIVSAIEAAARAAAQVMA